MLMSVSEFKKRSKGTEQIGDTLFIDGTPYTVCGVCGVHIKQFDGQRTVNASKGNKRVEIKPYKAAVLVKWLKEETIAYNSATRMHEVGIKHIPVIKTVASCFNCWYKQDQERQAKRLMGDNRAVAYGKNED